MRGSPRADLVAIAEALATQVDRLRFGPPVAYVYNPLVYAAAAHHDYLRRYGGGPHEVLLLGMNPGPFGMAQTGVPFGDVAMVRNWLKIEAPVARPASEHPRRPVLGFACPRREVSGSRLWGWAAATCGSAQHFFARFFVANYCPLVFMEAGGRNRTPDKLESRERAPLYAACDQALRGAVAVLSPRYVVGVGAFAEARAQAALAGRADLTIGRMPHPSPASPQANRDWALQASASLAALGIAL